MTPWLAPYVGYGWAWFIWTLIDIWLIAVPVMLAVAFIIYANRKIWAPPALDGNGEGEIGDPIKDFYLTNAICRASPTMQRCSAELIHGETFAEAAE